MNWHSPLLVVVRGEELAGRPPTALGVVRGSARYLISVAPSEGVAVSWVCRSWGSLGDYVTDVGEESSSVGDEATFVGRTSGYRVEVLTEQFERCTLGTSSGG